MATPQDINNFINSLDEKEQDAFLVRSWQGLTPQHQMDYGALKYPNDPFFQQHRYYANERTQPSTLEMAGQASKEATTPSNVVNKAVELGQEAHKGFEEAGNLISPNAKPLGLSDIANPERLAMTAGQHPKEAIAGLVKAVPDLVGVPQDKLGLILSGVGAAAESGILRGATKGVEEGGRGLAKIVAQASGFPASKAELISNSLGQWLSNSVKPQKIINGLVSQYTDAAQKLGIVPLEDSIQAAGGGRFPGATGALVKAVNEYIGPKGEEILADPVKASFQDLHNIVEAVSHKMDNPNMYPDLGAMRSIPRATKESLIAMRQAALDGMVQKAESISQGVGNVTNQEQLAATGQAESAKRLVDIQNAFDRMRLAITKGAEGTTQTAYNSILPREEIPLRTAHAENFPTKEVLERSQQKLSDLENMTNAEFLSANSGELGQAAEETVKAAKSIGPLRKNLAIAKTAQATNSPLARNLNGSMSLLRSMFMAEAPGVGSIFGSPLLGKLAIGAVRGGYLGAKELAPFAASLNAEENKPENENAK